MPQDAFTIRYLTRELAGELTGAKITKINQPFPDEILLYLFCKQKTRRLIISANPNLCRMHFTEESFPNPAQALSFQMTLRKHLSNGTVEEVSQDPFERVVRFRISTKNELSDYEVHTLVCELTGRTANLLLLRENDTVVAALHTTSLEAERRILPNLPYPPLAQDKLKPDDEDAVREALRFYEGDMKSFLLKRCKGFAKQTAMEIADSLSGDPASGIAAFCKRPAEPCVLFAGDAPADYFAFPYRTAGEEYRRYPSLSEAISAYFSEKNLRQRFRDKSAPLRSALKGQITKQEKKLQRISEKLLECEDMEKFRIYGELVTANLFRIKRGDKELCCQNYYEPECPEIRIPLDVQLEPAQNAQRYYRRYAKLKTAKDYALSQREESERLLDYLRSVEYSFSVCTRFEEVAELSAELQSAGILKKTPAKKKQKEEKITPFLFECEGYRIAVGKNNLQNDILSFKTAQAGDIWLHAKDYHGCHTLILNNGGKVPDKVIEVAAEIAAYYSQSDRESKTVVDYVDKKYLKKPPASPAGYVIYTNFKSIVVKPNSHDELRRE